MWKTEFQWSEEVRMALTRMHPFSMAMYSNRLHRQDCLVTSYSNYFKLHYIIDNLQLHFQCMLELNAESMYK